jgi:pre-rRNA-processing protein TSR1
MPDHHHRAGSLKQANKKNKRYKSSKRSATRDAGGKVAGHKQTAIGNAAQSKADRRNHQQQVRNTKKQELLKRKRGMLGATPPPRVVGIVSLSKTSGMEERLKNDMLRTADQVVYPMSESPEATVTCKYNVHKKDGALTFLTTNSFRQSGADNSDDDDDDAAVMAALDLARICDVLIFVIDGNAAKSGDTPLEIHIGDGNSVSTSKSASQDWDHLISSRGDRMLTAIKGQGLPTILTVLAQTETDELGDDHITMQSVKSLRRAGIKRSLELKKYVSRFALTEFGTGQDKVVEVDLSVHDDDAMVDEEGDEETKNVSTCAALIRTVCQISAGGPKFVSQVPRSYLISDSIQYNEATKELSLSGYVRGMGPLDINALVHVPNLGTFACKAVTKKATPLSELSKTVAVEDEVLLSDPERQEPLGMFAAPDALDGEQNLVGFDEDAEIEDSAGTDDNFARPAGWSTYQNAWLDAVDEDNFDDAVDGGEMAAALNQPKPKTSSNMSLGGDIMDLDDANDVNVSDKRAIRDQRRKEMKDHLQFPDEVDVDEDAKASERLARYRSLKSFRKSHWDPKENLPETYASIYHFKNFKATQRAVMSEMKDVVHAAEQAHGMFWGSSPSVKAQDDAMTTGSEDDEDDLLLGCVPSGSYVSLTLSNVPADKMRSFSPTSLLTAVSLLPHENKVSVLHMGLSQTQSCDSTTENPVKSKDVLVFRCGWRTWKARPVFSQNNLNCDKHKFERYMPQQGTFFAASIFGPVTYTPCPVLVFREGDAGRQLIAIGSMIGADADRIAVKRIVLTGFPVRVQKRWATVKYMFYNPDDVKWFKPAALYTKHGLQGNIEESVGEHGTMKCLFNAPIKQHDTICLPLYKRIFPKFVPEDGSSRDDKTLIGKPTLTVL